MKVHGESQPPEVEIREQATHTGALVVTAEDFKDFGIAISNIMTNQVKDTLGDAANLFKQQHKAGPRGLDSGPCKKHQVLPAEPHRYW